MSYFSNKEFSNEAINPSRLIDHFSKSHSDKASKPIVYFELLKNNLFQRNTINNCFSKVTNTNYTGLKLSYKIAKLIEKMGKPHTIGEHLIKAVIKEIAAELNENVKKLIN